MLGLFDFKELKFKEEKYDCRPFFWNAIGMADRAVTAVFNCSIAFDVANGTMAAVFNCSITFYITNG